jgi:hypothetical protein
LNNVLGEKLVAEISGRPTLGSWSKALDQLAANPSLLGIWQDWFKVIASEADRRTSLVRTRNRIEHPNYVPNEDLVDKGAIDLEQFFDRLIPRLRIAYGNIRTYICHGRNQQEVEPEHQVVILNCECFDAIQEPFPRRAIVVETQTSNLIPDDQLFCLCGKDVLLLKSFFMVKTVATQTREIFVYEKEYSGDKAVWSGLTTEQGHPLKAPKDLF